MTSSSFRNYGHSDHYIDGQIGRIDGQQNTYDARYRYFISAYTMKYETQNTLKQIKNINRTINMKMDII